ncbi:hypothetical protein ACPF04_02220 [Campylobacter sp. MOP51]|uniref:hypothetical protein n=1 Tax=Campylobacter canis TaxID=3378588 RepID=UPI003C3793D2
MNRLLKRGLKIAKFGVKFSFRQELSANFAILREFVNASSLKPNPSGFMRLKDSKKSKFANQI